LALAVASLFPFLHIKYLDETILGIYLLALNLLRIKEELKYTGFLEIRFIYFWDFL
jgi:hypothetical protein